MNEIPPLNEAFNRPSESKMQVASAFIDITGSTGMQQNLPEASWLPQLGWFYWVLPGLMADLAEKTGAPVDSKYLGDGVMVTVGSRHATELVNFAIEVQETVCRANRRDADGGAGAIEFNVSVGVVTGTAYRFRSPDGLIDYASKAISTARRLCDIASPRAVLIDRSTERTCNGSAVESRIGRAHDRTPDEYFGAATTVALKGLNSPVEFFEVLWETDRFGVKGAVADTSSAAAVRDLNAPPPRPQPAATTRDDRPQRSSGEVKVWKPDSGFGFIRRDVDGEEFFFNRRLLAFSEDAEDIKVGDRVAFLTLAPAREGTARRAAVILFDDERADGVIHAMPNETHPYGWVVVTDSRGTRHFVYVPQDALPAHLKHGAGVQFTVRVGSRGAAAESIEPIASDVSATAA